MDVTRILIPLALLLALAAVVLLLLARRKRVASGLPPGRVIYDDSGAQRTLEKPLYDPLLNLTGKPDYLVDVDGVWVPVEVKSGYAPAQPYQSHVMQLAAYCRLVAVTSGKTPPYGIIRYRNRALAVDNTPALQAALAEQIAAMKIADRQVDVPRSHQNPARCRSCGYRHHCDQRLA
ncbi:MAG: Dna2/Cas4 domain-containing protein [Anaerolineae bacterium]|nr:Dna2/Cas4 domain-containing protein [Anaerolineae bacterium]